MKKMNRGISIRKDAVIGAVVAAAGAGAYYLLGPKGKQHRAQAKVLIGAMENEMKREYIKAKGITRSLYHKAVDTLAVNYRKQYRNHVGVINALAKKLKGDWESVKHGVSAPLH